MPTPFSWAIDTDDLDPSKLTSLIDELTSMLGEIDTELSPTGQRTFDLRITSLSYDSPALVGVLARPRPKQPDITERAVIDCAEGWTLIERESTRPAAFNDDALEHLRNVGNATGNGIRNVRMHTPLVLIEPVITRRASAHIERILPHGYSVGSVEGRLEGLNIHGQTQFTVYDTVTGRAVQCYFKDVQLEDVKDAVGRKVLVSGNLRRDPSGRPQKYGALSFSV